MLMGHLDGSYLLNRTRTRLVAVSDPEILPYGIENNILAGKEPILISNDEPLDGQYSKLYGVQKWNWIVGSLRNF